MCGDNLGEVPKVPAARRVPIFPTIGLTQTHARLIKKAPQGCCGAQGVIVHWNWIAPAACVTVRLRTVRPDANLNRKSIRGYVDDSTADRARIERAAKAQ